MRLTRRRLLVAAAVGATGCLDDGNDDTPNGTDGDGDASDGNRTDGGNETENGADATDGGTEASDGSDGGSGAREAGFRSWLTDERLREGSNLRFDYARGYNEAFVGGRVEPLGLSSDNVEGHVTQSGRVVHLGDFDVGAVTERIETAEGFRTTDEYAGFTVAEGTVEAGDDSVSFPVAVGEDAVVVGEGYEAPIDAHRGERETLVESEPEFGVLFDALPIGDSATVAGQTGVPPGTGTTVAEYVSVSGVAHETPTGGETDWVYIFKDGGDVTPKRAGILASSVQSGFGEVSDTVTDGRVVRLKGSVPRPNSE
jgi:hypothetical protein